MISYRKFCYLKEQLLLESFKDALTKWSKTNDKEEVKSYIDQFKSLRDKNQLEGDSKDISFWMNKPFDDFKSFVDEKVAEYQTKIPLKKKAKDEDAPIIFENDKVIMRRVKTKAVSCKLGSGADWCVSKEQHEYWEEYVDKDEKTFYYIEKKVKENKKEDKYMVEVFPNYYRKAVLNDEGEQPTKSYLDDNLLCRIWDMRDNNLGDEFLSIVKPLGIPLDKLKAMTDIETDSLGIIVGTKKFKYKLEGGDRVFDSIDLSGMKIKTLPDFANA